MSNSLDSSYIDGKNVLWIKRYQNFVLVGTTDGLWYMANPTADVTEGSSWSHILDNIPVSCCLIDNDNDNAYIGADNGLYVLSICGDAYK